MAPVTIWAGGQRCKCKGKGGGDAWLLAVPSTTNARSRMLAAPNLAEERGGTSRVRLYYIYLQQASCGWRQPPAQLTASSTCANQAKHVARADASTHLLSQQAIGVVKVGIELACLIKKAVGYTAQKMQQACRLGLQYAWVCRVAVRKEGNTGGYMLPGVADFHPASVRRGKSAPFSEQGEAEKEY